MDKDANEKIPVGNNSHPRRRYKKISTIILKKVCWDISFPFMFPAGINSNKVIIYYTHRLNYN